MGWLYVRVVLVMVVSLNGQLCHGCWEQERLAILQLMSAWFNGTLDQSWADQPNTDCCDWRIVECNNTTGRVTKLYLDDMTNITHNGDLLDMTNITHNDDLLLLNASYLLPFEQLESLHLQGNSLAGFVDHQELFKLSRLEELYLGKSNIQKSFLRSMGALSSLKVLSFRQGLGNVKTLPEEGWCNLKNLLELDLSGNELEGPIPSCLRNLTSLQLLDLSHNFFTGNIDLSPLPNLTSLVYLSLSNNSFQASVSFQSFANHSNLKVILYNENELIQETASQTRPPKFQLKMFTLSNCKFVGSRTLPSFLYHQNDLRTIDFANTNFGGNFPSWLLKNNTRLEMVLLRNNSFTGPLQLPPHPSPDIHFIDVSNNYLQGQIPTNTSSTFPSLEHLIMSWNDFEGNIPPGLGYLRYLILLDLSSNQLSGGIPQQLSMKNTSLWVLKLSHNNLGGQIYPTVFNSTELLYLYLNGNNFEGNLPYISSEFLSLLDVSDNHFSGKLPRWIGNLSNLVGIDLSNNLFEGSIPLEFCKLDLLEFFYLSENNLSGSIPSCFSPPIIRHVHLRNNILRGPMTNAFNGSYFLVTLDLSHNDMTGTIPNWLGNLSALSILLLQRNRFNGNISFQLCHMKLLTMLDLSHNNLSGPIPSCLSDLTFEEAHEKSITTNTQNSFVSESRSLVALMERFKLKKSSDLPFGSEYDDSFMQVPHMVDFTTKGLSLTYKGYILDFMSGIDLSSNQLTGNIPPEIGHLSNIRALNLSHNNFIGSIPTTFSNLKLIESLDLSFNNLDDKIPCQLTELNSLAIFNVAYNNLSGATPERKGQFGTFDESSYEGNPLLCGPPLPRNCSKTNESSSTFSNSNNEDGGNIDMDIFYVTFLASYTVVLLCIIGVLCMNPHWRQTWFYFIEDCITTCYIICRQCIKD